MKHDDPIKELLIKYKMDRPLPDDQRRRMRKIKKHTLVTIIKKQGKYSTFLFVVISFYLWIKRVGISLSLGKSAVVILSAITVLGGAAAAGAIYIISRSAAPEMECIEQGRNAPAGEARGSGRTTAPNYRAIIVPLEYDPEIGQAGALANNLIRNELNGMKGGAAVTPPGSSGSDKAKKILTGSVVKLENMYTITVRIIDRNTSRILYFGSENAESEHDIPRACRELSARIADKL